ncbi:MAG: hypothetical protein AAFQ71_02760 [Planctomycetota bacterium]
MLGVPIDQLALSEDSRTALAILAFVQAELKDYIASLNDFDRGRLLGRIYGEIVKEIERGAIPGMSNSLSASPFGIVPE